MSPKLARYYREERKADVTTRVGYSAVQALDNARLRIKWAALEAAGYVRLMAIPDDDFDPGDVCDCRDPKCEARDAYERDGAWGSVGEYRLDPAETDYEREGRDGWIHGDSVWGHVGYNNVLDPHENCYIYDIMSETIDQFKAAWKEHVRGVCPACHGTGRK